LRATQLEANKILAELPDRIRTHRQRRKTAAFMPSRQAVGDVLADIPAISKKPQPLAGNEATAAERQRETNAIRDEAVSPYHRPKPQTSTVQLG
jgi:hypothetical protein